MPLSDFPKHEQPEIVKMLLYRMHESGDLSVEDAAKCLFGSTRPFDLVRAEFILEELWDMEVACCMGHYRNFNYAITTEGKNLLCTTPS